MSAYSVSFRANSDRLAVVSFRPMGNVEHRTISAGVRAARLAVLVERPDLDWQHTCRRILEYLSQVWGGQYSVIVPTDGSSIDPMFWSVLDAFDPDYICEYHSSVLDEKLAAPSKYNQRLETELTSHFPDRAASEIEREHIESALCNSRFRRKGISSELELEIKMRLAPFFFEKSVLQGNYFSARSGVGYPLTSVSAILPLCEHPGRLSIIDSTIANIPPLWIEAVTGSTCDEYAVPFADVGVEVVRTTFGDSDAWDLFDVVMKGKVGESRRRIRASLKGEAQKPTSDPLTATPFEFSMLGLSQYSMLGENTWELSVVVVFGSAFEDFALYFGLSRMRGDVYWLPLEWIDDNENTSVAQGPSIQNGSHAQRFGYAVVAAATDHKDVKIDFLSASVDRSGLEAAIERLSRASTPDLKLRACVNLGDVSTLLSRPRVVYNTDNYSVATTHQIAEGRIPGFFPTPKPKGFRKIAPYEHRWITELTFDGLSYPRHPALGQEIVIHRNLSTHGARISSRGACYFCPNVGYVGSGDIDTNLVHPQVRLPEAGEVFQLLSLSAGWNVKISDKGAFSRDTVTKLGGLGVAAVFIRDARHWSVLKEFLKDGRHQSAGGIFLASDRRRYLEFGTISKLMGGSKEAVILVDSLLNHAVLHRGIVLKCEYCRTADWFSMSELAHEFRCKRCRRKQRILSRHALERDEPTWHYQLDEICYQGVRNNMHVPLLALDHLRRASRSFTYTDELEIWEPTEAKPSIEIDVCCICDGVLTIGEAKTTKRIEGGGKAERRSLEKYKVAALALGARRFVLVTSEEWSQETITNVRNAFAGTRVEVVSLSGKEIGVPDEAG